MAKPQLYLKGDRELIAKLKRLTKKSQAKKVLRQATTASATVIVKGVRRAWPQDSGISAAAVDKKIITTRSGYAAIIGTDRSVVEEVDGKTHIPSNIDHLIELGWQTPDGVSVPARAPLRRGYDATHEAAEAVFASKAATAVEKELSK